jgi:predicted aminopeptidase
MAGHSASLSIPSRHASRVTRHDPPFLSASSVVRFIAILTVSTTLSGCYLMQAAQGQMSVMSKREPLSKVIADQETPAETRRRLQLLSEAREFASRELGLPDNDSYRSYVELKADYVVWNVFATPRYSVQPLNWCFPVAGCVVYRGYFKANAAERYARRARLSGKDATVAGVSAYSTLGHFDDPILSSMLKWSDTQVIATLFHELAHQVVYVAGDSAFNESFASVVEEAGIARWLALRGSEGDIDRWRTSRMRSKQFTQLLLNTRERLRTLYASGLSETELAIRKPQEFGRMKFEYWQLKASWNNFAGYDAWFNRAISNADLVSAATYDGCVPGLQKLLAEVGQELPRFYEAVKEMSATERKQVCST